MTLAFTTDGRLRRGLRPLAAPVAFTAVVVAAASVHPVERATRRADRAYRLALRDGDPDLARTRIDAAFTAYLTTSAP